MIGQLILGDDKTIGLVTRWVYSEKPGHFYAKCLTHIAQHGINCRNIRATPSKPRIRVYTSKNLADCTNLEY